MNRKWNLLPLLALLLPACSPPAVTISSERMLERGYDTYKTYAFIPTTDTMYGRMINRAVFVPTLVSEAITLIERRGLKMDTINPDVLFTYHLVLAQNFDLSAQQNIVYNQQLVSVASMPGAVGGFGFGPGTMPGVAIGAGSGGVFGSTNVRQNTAIGSDRYVFTSNNRPYSYQGKINIDTLREGTMVIDMIDKASNRVAWRCVAQGSKREKDKLPPDQAVKKFLPMMLKKMPRK